MHLLNLLIFYSIAFCGIAYSRNMLHSLSCWLTLIFLGATFAVFS